MINTTNVGREWPALKYLPDDLKSEFIRLSNECPDLLGIAHPLINVSDTLRAYFILAHYFTDDSSGQRAETMLVGIRSVDLLCSALGRQYASYGGRTKYTNPIDICATLFYGFVKNHAFLDGNKRTALLILLYQLQLYGFYPTKSEKYYESLVVATASNSLGTKFTREYNKFQHSDDQIVATIAYILRHSTAKKTHAYNCEPTAREFVDALIAQGVTCNLDNAKIHFSYDVKKMLRTEHHQYAIVFGGWTRTVGAKTARDTLNALGLYDEFSSYQGLLEGAEPMYKLVGTFDLPLRRLKDK